MVKKLVNYAFTTAIYEEKRNFLETFSPFVLKVLYDNNCLITDQKLSDDLFAKYQLQIPINTIKSIISGLDSHGLVEKKAASRDSWQVSINEKGKKEIDLLSVNEDIVKRRQNHLIKSFVDFLSKKGIEKNNEEAENLILEFVHNNLHKLSIFNIDDFDNENHIEVFSEKENVYLTQFIDEIYNCEPTLYETYEEVLKGLIIREYIQSSEDVSSISKIEPLVIYLDANIILSLLEFHNPAINNAAKQLIKLLSETEGIRLKIFSITLHEIARLLSNYKNLKDNYNTSIPVNSVFYYLKSKGYNDVKTDSFISNLDKKIENLGVIVEKLDLIEEHKLQGHDKELYKDIYTYKNEQNKNRSNGLIRDEKVIHISALHDANIILAIQKKRGSWVKTLERSKAIFLTSSYLMDYFCKKNSRNNDRFPEVILDLTLTNIFWLRNPRKEIGIHLHQLISAHSKRFIVDNGIWNRFFSTIKAMNEDGLISIEDMASVISNNQITLDYLHHVNVDDISVDSVLELTKQVEIEIKMKDELIIKKEEIIQEVIKETDSVKITIQEKEKIINSLENENENLKMSLDSTKNDISRLKEEKKLRDFITQKMDKEFYPLSRKFGWFIIWFLTAIFMIFITEIMDENLFIRTGVHNWWIYLIVKIASYGGLIIFSLSNFNNMRDILNYRISHSSLKRKFEKKFITEFHEKKK